MVRGIDDDAVLDTANREEALLMTSDKDFGEIVFRQNRASFGVLLIRLEGLKPETRAEITGDALGVHERELSRTFSVLSPSTIRIRRDIS